MLSSAVLQDADLMRKFAAVEKMDEDDKHVITSLIDAYSKKQQIESAMCG